MYRYLTGNEEERVVSLRREMDFVEQYVDLLRVRFPEGLDVETDIPEDLLSRKVVPCSVQLLIENAIKHNAVEPADPLHIRIRASGDTLTVSNNRKPRLRQAPSAGLGQKYLRGQYRDVAGKEVSILSTDSEYIVEIPLI